MTHQRLQLPVLQYFVTRIGFEPSIGQAVTVFVGDVMYQEFDQEVPVAAKISAQTTVPLLDATIRLPVNAWMPGIREIGQEQFCTEFPAYYDADGNAIDVVCFLDQNLQGWFEWARVPKIHGIRWNRIMPLTYELHELKEDGRKLDTGLRTELVYQGMANNVLNIGYREYVNNMIRLGFRQQMQYTLAPNSSTFIRIHNIELEVFRADNNSVEYRIVRRD